MQTAVLDGLRRLDARTFDGMDPDERALLRGYLERIRGSLRGEEDGSQSSGEGPQSTKKEGEHE